MRTCLTVSKVFELSQYQPFAVSVRPVAYKLQGSADDRIMPSASNTPAKHEASMQTLASGMALLNQSSDRSHRLS